MLTATVVIHGALARTEAERALGVWLMPGGEDEAAGVADPLASIARRRAGGAAVDPDVADLLKAGAAAAGYAFKNASKAVQIRLAMRRATRAGMIPDPEESPE